jgi:hypothetical protein
MGVRAYLLAVVPTTFTKMCYSYWSYGNYRTICQTFRNIDFVIEEAKICFRFTFLMRLVCAVVRIINRFLYE